MLEDDRGGAPAPALGDRGDAGLPAAVNRLRGELASYRRPLPDRAVAEDELDALAAQAAEPAPDQERLRHSLLLVAAALGSVSALSAALEGLREAVEAQGPNGGNGTDGIHGVPR
ncbi:DUF5955 family protein [Actinacidiphila rubida]|uniref:DUF5955 family protein n=1 Tax=Actinacidiphila rubida TaxID=310780 RepID=UPI00084998CD|nr:DUF5955 family protein [Actinacidiphila rubida]